MSRNISGHPKGTYTKKIVNINFSLISHELKDCLLGCSGYLKYWIFLLAICSGLLIHEEVLQKNHQYKFQEWILILGHGQCNLIYTGILLKIQRIFGGKTVFNITLDKINLKDCTWTVFTCKAFFTFTLSLNHDINIGGSFYSPSFFQIHNSYTIYECYSSK